MSRYGITDEQAFTLLRQASNHRNERLRDIAEEVIMTGWLDGVPETTAGGSDAPPTTTSLGGSDGLPVAHPSH